MKNLISMYVKMQSMLKDEKGATMVEYALLVAFIALIAVVGAEVLGEGLSSQFSTLAGSIKGPSTPSP